MRKWFLILMLGALFVFPPFASAQTDVTLTSVNVQLWPEYDQPSMLVIVDYIVPADIKLPINLKFRIPQEADLVAVANYTPEGALLDAVVPEEPKVEGTWQVFTVTLDTLKGRFEYYQPISFNGNQRIFAYLWDDAYTVDAFNIRVLEPLDTTALTTTPKLDSISQEGDQKYFSGKPVNLAKDEQFTLNLEYQKSSNTLIAPPQAIQPSAPVDEKTSGRVSFNNYLPYIIGGVGALLVLGGMVYYLQANKKSTKTSRRRSRSSSGSDEVSDTYCSQCGARARGGDRFCRTCGSRIKQNED